MNLILPFEKKFMSANIKDKNINTVAVKLIDILFQYLWFLQKWEISIRNTKVGTAQKVPIITNRK